MKLLISATAFLLASCLAAQAGGDRAAVRLAEAIGAGLGIVQKAAANYPENRSCFSCHHQTLPMLAMVEARGSGAKIDSELLQAQAAFTHEFYKDRTAKVAAGEGVGGRSMTVAYSLWALDLAAREPDRVSDALTGYLLKSQKEDGHWQLQSHRPPLEESHAMTTFLAAYYLRRFAPEVKRDEIEQAGVNARRWLTEFDAKSQEDLNAKLWASVELDGDVAADSARVAGMREAILAKQNDDGGWSQLPGMASDAYATGQTLFVLDETGLPDGDGAVSRRVEFLLSSQKADGSWLVETRSKPVQRFFDNGDPHGKHQFISVAATSWAVAALSRAGSAH